MRYLSVTDIAKMKSGKICPELSLRNHVMESHRAMLFQILSVHPPIFSDRAFLIGKLQIRDVVISNQHIVHIVDTLFVFHKLDLDFKIFVTSRLTGVVELPSSLKKLDITGDFRDFCK